MREGDSLVDIAEAGDLDELRRRLDRGDDPDEKGTDGRVPLHAALAEAHIAIARLLMDRGADLSPVDAHGSTVLHWASFADSVAPLDLVATETRLDVDARDRAGRTPLSWSAQGNRCVAMRWLLEHGADSSSFDDDGWAPIHHAASTGSAGAVVLLLDAGASALLRMRPEPGEDFGHLASDLARHFAPDCPEVLAVLLAAEDGRAYRA